MNEYDFPDTYEFHRANAKAMDDETLLRNMPLTTDQGFWSKAMRDEAKDRGLTVSED